MIDTIFALASAPGKAGIAVLRISGPAAHRAVQELAGDLPPPRHAALRVLRWRGAVLDEALVLVFRPGASFTGEAMAELQLHGSTAVTRAVLRALSDISGLRMAEPGEFTRRALENGRLDLTQVEGLADLIDAETEAQRRQALRVMSGSVGRRADLWRRQLIRAAALLEATIDFADEDVPVDVTPEVSGLIDMLLAEFRAEVVGAGAAERVRDGFEVALVGRPNSGKSTLINKLAGRDVALTSELPGTTRDVIELRMELAGLPVTFLDMAGIRPTEDLVEGMGIARASERARTADLRIFLLDEEGVPDGVQPQQGDIFVRGKGDLGFGGDSVSGLTGLGVRELLDRIAAVLEVRVAGVGAVTRERHRAAIDRAIDALEAARFGVKDQDGRSEIVVEDVRSAMRALDGLVGRIGVEALLDEIFASFCIGK